MQRFCLIWKQQFLSWNHIWSKPLRKLCKVLAINLIAHFIQLGLYGTTCNDWIFAFLIQWKFPYFIGKTKFWCKDLRHQLSIKKLKTLQFAFYFRCCCHFNFSFLALLYTIIFSPLSDVLLCKLKMDLANPKCFWLAANFRLSDFSSPLTRFSTCCNCKKTRLEKNSATEVVCNSISTLGIASRKIGHENGLVIEVESERLSPS